MRNRHLGHFLVDALLAHRGRTALIETRKDRVQRRMDYAEVLDQAASLALHLRDRGLGPGDRVAILASNGPGWLVGAIGVFWIGALLVPLDARLSATEQDTLLAHARPSLLLADQGLADALARWDGPTLAVEGPDWPVQGAPDPLPPVAECDPEDPATLVYTSGTSGEPRGCLLSHRAYLAQHRLLEQVAPLGPDDRWFSFLPTNHAIDFLCGFLGPLHAGATVVHQRVLRPEHLAWTLRTQGITHCAAVPALLEALQRSLHARLEALPPWKRSALDHLADVHERLTWRGPDPRVADLLLRPVRQSFGGRLKRIYCGGAFTDPALIRDFNRLGLPVAVGYGLTEACTVISLQDLSPVRPDTVGRPLPGLDVRIHAPDPAGVGEVYVRGPTLMSGYLDDPEATKAAFTEDGFLRTGDIGRFDPAGHLQLVGRARNRIVTAGGKNIYPEDVEAGLSLPCDELAVFAAGYLWPDRGLGGAAEELIAVVRGHAPTVDAALAAQQRSRPERMRIRGVVDVNEPFPRTSTRKIRRGELAERVRAAGLQPMPLGGQP